VVFLSIFIVTTAYFISGHMSFVRMASKAKMNVQSFPRPPLLDKTPRHLQIKWNGHLIADTKDAYWALETHHPPTYYFPPSSIKVPLTKTRRTTYCEWKGAATYWSITNPENSSETVSNRIWSYENPTKGFEAIKDYLSFYAGPWDCFVDGEKVEPQPGDFYGGWVTSDIDGIVKGKNGNWDPIL
jgi:uncharacterized protein (DUF427 family)